jgi:hypothetical protein
MEHGTQSVKVPTLTVRAGPEGAFKVVRYHSLVVDEDSLPPQLPAIAWTCGGTQAVRPQGCQAAVACSNDGPDTVMAVAHAQQPLFGVQFHPESVATMFGDAVLRNFRDIAVAHRGLLLPQYLRPPTENGVLTCRVLARPHSCDIGLPISLLSWEFKYMRQEEPGEVTAQLKSSLWCRLSSAGPL